MKVIVTIILLLLAALFLLSQLAPGDSERKALTATVAPDYQGDISNGRRLFQSRCTGCHGTDLMGTNQGPPLLHGYYHPSHHSDLAIRMAVKTGVAQHHWQFGNMPAIPGIDAEGIADLTAYIRTEQKRAGIIP